MERSLLKEATKANIEAFVNKKREIFLQTMFWQRFFPLKYTTQLTWESLAGSGGNPVMADVIEYNASAPLKSRRTITKSTGDIPKLALKRHMDEKDMNEYNTINALMQGDANKSALLDIVFNDVDFCYTGVMARTEQLCGQALSKGAIALTLSNNNGIITEVDCDFGIPAANKTGAAVIWSSPSTATPLTDIRTKLETARALGYPLGYIIMDRATLVNMLATTQVKDEYAVYQRVAISRKTTPTFGDLNQMLTANLLPQIILWDTMVRFETQAHVISNISPWEAGYVAFIPELNVGNVLHGPIAEEGSAAIAKKAIMVKRDHVLISKWAELEPFGEFTKGVANAFPRFNDVNGIFMLNTLNATTFA